MKKFLLAFIVIFAMAFTQNADAQTVSYPFGYADELTGTIAADSAASFSTANLVTYATLSADTNVYINLAPSGLKTGATFYLEVTADATTRYIYFNDKATGANDSVVASKTVIFTLVYDDDNDVYKLVSRNQIN